MNAAFAFLANTGVHNRVRKLAWEIHQKYRTDLGVCRLPPHISLKQPFEISDLTALEGYMSELAGSISSFEIFLTELQLVPTVMDGSETGILWVDVEDTEILRQLHERVNFELSQRFENTQAAFDGPDYHFHLTVTIGGQPLDVYRRLYDEIPEKRIDLRFRVKELAMFVYDEPSSLNANYIAYKILPIRGSEVKRN